MTPKAKERLARLERRAKYLEQRIADDNLRGDTRRQHHYRRAEASALRWAVEHIRVLESTVDAMPAEIADYLTRCAPDIGDEVSEDEVVWKLSGAMFRDAEYELMVTSRLAR